MPLRDIQLRYLMPDAQLWQLKHSPPAPQAWEFDVPLRVVGLQGSVPGQWKADFNSVTGGHAKLALQQRKQLADIYGELLSGAGGAKSAAGADLVTVGDAWLAPAIRAGALQPLRDHERWRWWVEPSLLPHASSDHDHRGSLPAPGSRRGKCSTDSMFHRLRALQSVATAPGTPGGILACAT